MSVLEVKNISKFYGEYKAVDNLSFAVQSGRIYGLLGPNGAGKTTTIRMIMNILLPDSGEITLFEQKMSEELKRRIGYLPEERGLYKKMKVIDMLVFLGKLHNMSSAEAIKQVNIWLEKLKLTDWRDKKIEELSKGMQQKIQFIGTIMHEPELIILDEPFSGLDPINIQLIKETIIELKKQNKAIIFSTHLLDAAEKLSDDILLINKGKNILEGELGHIKKQFGKNAAQIEYTGNIEIIRSLPMVQKIDNYGNYVEVILPKEQKPSDLLRAIADKIEISRFETSVSSLNEIFIDMVGRDKNE